MTADLSSALERDEIDLSIVSDKTAVFRDGVLLVGSHERVKLHRTGFERAVTGTDMESLRERFDTMLENIAIFGQSSDL